MITDIIDRPIAVGDYVVFTITNNIYVVKKVEHGDAAGRGYASIMLAKPSSTTKPVRKFSKDMCLIPGPDVLIWLLKKK